MHKLIASLATGSAALALNLIALPASRRKLSILIFHQVLADFDPMRPTEVTAKEFEWHLKILKQYFTPLALTEAVPLLQQERLPRNAVCITFDDGYADNEQVALPLLQKWDIPATFFVASGYLDGGRMWNDSIIEAVRRASEAVLDLQNLGLGSFATNTDAEKYATASEIITKIKHESPDKRQQLTDEIVTRIGQDLPSDLMMRQSQVRHLHSAGMDVGGHTVNHPILAALSDNAASEEIGRNKEVLESICGGPLNSFAYPNGKPGSDYTQAHVEIVKRCGYRCAVATTWGVNQQRSDIYQLNRFTPWDKETHSYLLRMLRNHFA